MKINRQDLTSAAKDGIIATEQVEALWLFLSDRNRNTPSFNFTHILYYLGGLIAITAMSLFMTLGWETFGGWGIFSISLIYMLLTLVLTEALQRRGLMIPAGITAALTVVLIPLAIYGLQQALGFWDGRRNYRDYHVYIDWTWLLMELGTLAGAALIFFRYRLPFLLMPVVVTLWYLSMDLVPFIFHDLDHNWELRKLVSLFFGLAMTGFALWVDLRSGRQQDFAFWLYLFGVATFWGGLSLMHSDSELNKLIYCGINLLLIGCGAVLSRRVFAVFGGFGVAGYLGHLAYSVFKDSFFFPLALSAIGLGIIALGIAWQKHERQISATLRSRLPLPIQETLEERRS